MKSPAEEVAATRFVTAIFWGEPYPLEFLTWLVYRSLKFMPMPDLCFKLVLAGKAVSTV